MASKASESGMAARYALALFELADEQRKLDVVAACGAIQIRAAICGLCRHTGERASGDGAEQIKVYRDVPGS